MWMIIILLFLVIAGLLIRINYQTHCIADLEKSKSNVIRKHSAEILDLMEILKNILVTYDMPATRDSQIRNFINDNVEKYSSMYRKNELNTAGNENV